MERRNMSNASVQGEKDRQWTLSLSHGTLECRDLDATRRFYQDFLGLQTVLRGRMAVWFRCGGGWMVASVCTGERQQALPIDSRWCLDMSSPEEVDSAHQAAAECAAKYNIQEIRPIEQDGARRAFFLRDLDDNWWEICHRPGRLFDDEFERAGVLAQ
jgi:catechol 2,3-dioxygenase-like lactoylglutathione lyase family enzyme